MSKKLLVALATALAVSCSLVGVAAAADAMPKVTVTFADPISRELHD